MTPDAHAHHADHDHTPNHHAHHKGFRGVGGLALALGMARRGRGRADLAVRLAGVGPQDTAVDVGAGPGGAVRRAAGLGATAIGVEPARVMRAVARALSIGRPRVRYVTGTAEAIPLGDGVATVAWSVATVHHWADIDGGLGEVRRILRPGGRFLAVERRTVAGAEGLASHGWTPEQAAAFAARCEALGFASTRIEEASTEDMDVLAVLATVPSA
jgi:SAM-dependent methyltransferase